MKICILSDSHDRRDMLAAAVHDAKIDGAEAVLHCGDLVAPSTLHAIVPMGLPVHVIHGNNTGDLYYLSKLAHESGGQINYYGQDATVMLADRRVFIVHFPHYARAMALTGEFDLVCHGHDHRARIEKIKNVRDTETVVVNPGTVGAVGALPTYVLGDLATMKFEVRDLIDAAATYGRVRKSTRPRP